MIRTSTHTLKFCNEGKREVINDLIDEYQRLLTIIIDDIWANGYECFNISKHKLDVPLFIKTQKMKTYETWLSSGIRQVVARHALIMIRHASKKRQQQLFILKRAQRAGKYTRYLQSKIDRYPLVKPVITNCKITLDQRFVNFEEPKSSGLAFIRIGGTGCHKIKVPIKFTTASNKWSMLGQRKKSIILSRDDIRLIFDIKQAKLQGSSIVGADQGITTVLSMSDGQTTKHCPHNHTLSTIQSKLSRKKKGSKAFRRAQEHRKNHINWSLRQLDFDNIKELRLEKLRNVGRGQRTSRFLSHWAYTLIKDKLTRLSETEGFVLKEVSNEFRSQRCSQCGWVRKANRKGKTFKCTSCGYTHNADLNAASNLALDLFEIPFGVRLKKMNQKGFFWKSDGLFSDCQERIVPDARQASQQSDVHT